MTTTALTDRAHPSDQQLAAFVDGQLSGDARQRIVEHLAACDDCYAVFQSVSEFAEEEQEPGAEGRADGRVVPLARRRRRRIAAIAGPLAAAAGLMVVLGPSLQGWWGERQLFQASAKREHRVIAARLGREPQYQPAPQVMRGEGENDHADALVEGKAAGLLEAVEDGGSVAELRRAGIAALLIKDFDQAIAHLENAVKAGGKDVKLYTALAAAYQAKAAFRNDRDAASKAVRYAETAWKMEQTPVSAWNRAIAYRTANDAREKAAWQDYLKLDGDSPWAAEARDNL